MKRLILPLFALLFIAPSLVAQDEARTVSSQTKEVTVFLRGAQIYREAQVSLSEGTNVIKFDGLSAGINANSIQVGGNKEFTIVSVNHSYNYLKDPKTSPRIKGIKDSLVDAQFNLDLRGRHAKVYLEEKSMLIANKAIGGSDAGVNIEDLMEMADFYRNRLKDIELKLMDIREEEKELKSTIKRLKAQLNQLNAKANVRTSEIVVTIASKVRTSARVFLSYFVNNASWVPTYDIRSKEVNGPITLAYKAQVYQNCGNDWNKVKLTLSTGNPSLDNTQPTPYPWVLSYYTAYRGGSKGYKRKAMANSRYDYAESEDSEADEPMAPNMDGNLAVTGVGGVAVQSNVNTEFKIPVPYTIKSDGQMNMVEINNYNLPATYKYYAAPKFDKDAFLLARITGWDEYNLLSGNANVYYAGTYIGKSYIDAAVTQDTMDLSMGRDQGIVVDRKKLKEFCKKSTVGSTKKTTMAMEITVRNTKSSSVKFLLEDQVPISRTKEIEVQLLEKSGAKHNENTGALKWDFELGPGETKKFILKYQVKYPKDKVISNL